MSSILHLQKVNVSLPPLSLLPSSLSRSIGTLHGLNPEYDDEITLLQPQMSPNSLSPSPSIRYLKKSTMEEIKVEGLGLDEKALPTERVEGAGGGRREVEGGGFSGFGEERRKSDLLEFQDKESLPPETYGRKWKAGKNWENLKENLIKLYSNKTVLLFGFLSLFVLFAYDMKRAYFYNDRYDVGFDVILGVVMAIFLIENIISAIIKNRINFFYYAELFATLTIILDFTIVDKKIYEYRKE